MAHRVQLLNNISWMILLLIAGCKQNSKQSIHQYLISRSDTDLHSVNGVMFLKDQALTGTVFLIYPGTSDTAEIAVYKEGKENGTWKKFYPNGLLKEKREFSNGKKTSDYMAWWENGKQQLHYLFKDDEYEGTCMEWNTTGKLVKEMNYKKGHEEGVQRWWYDNGKIKANYVITNGRRYGLLGTKNCINVSDSVFKN